MQDRHFEMAVPGSGAAFGRGPSRYLLGTAHWARGSRPRNTRPVGVPALPCGATPLLSRPGRAVNGRRHDGTLPPLLASLSPRVHFIYSVYIVCFRETARAC